MKRPRNHPLPLLFGQPFCLFWKVGDQKECDDADKNGEDALENKNPSPTAISADPLHFGYGAGKKATKRTGNEYRAPVNGESPLSLFAFVPETDEIET